MPPNAERKPIDRQPMKQILFEASTGDKWERTVEADGVIEVSRQATEKTAENLDAVLMCSLDLGHRAQRMQQAWLRVLDRSLSVAVRNPSGLPNFTQ